ncbi:BCCT family transporter [Clostridiales bacterium COT073_COT-073]|nr:BCCT family transporter [Clostridiales bacterium COT073_COT-073]
MRKDNILSEKKLDTLLIAVSLIFVVSVVVCLYVMPEKSQQIANIIFTFFTDAFGSMTLLFAFFGILLLVGVSFSKYGKIKLGEEEPEYSTFKWVAMMISCGLGSATVYWAFMEWAYYIGTPGLGIEAGSQLAFEMSVSYTMFHWGFSAWTLYALAGVPIAYHFHVRKNKGLSLSGIISAITGLKQEGVICRVVDVLFIFICFGGLSITLGVSVPLVTEIFCNVVGIEPSFIMNLFIIVVLSVLYSFSSYIGLKKGMAKLSDWNVKMVIAFMIGIVVLGPTLFIINNTTQSLGLMLHNFIPMSFFTDSIGKSGFPEAWTIFYWLYWITYAPFTGIFIAKVSKGRTIRSVVANTLISGSVGCFAFFGVLGGLSLHRQINNIIDVVGMLNNGKSNAAVVDVLRSLPMGSVFMIIFCVITLLFLATTLDGAAFTMATTSTKGLKNDEEPHPVLRLFWCIMLALVPLTMILINANLNTIKTCAIITAVPIIFIMLIMLIGWLRWMIKDYGKQK